MLMNCKLKLRTDIMQNSSYPKFLITYSLLVFTCFLVTSVYAQDPTLQAVNYTAKEKNCVKENFYATSGTGNYIFNNYNFRSNVYTIDPEVKFYLERLNSILTEKGSQLIIVTPLLKSITENEHLSVDNPDHLNFPLEQRLSEYGVLLTELESLGFLAPNVYEVFKETGLEEDFYIDYDSHWNITGSRLTARAIANKILNHPAYASLTKQAFKTVIDGEVSFNGISPRLQELCAITIAKFQSPDHKTIKVSPETSSSTNSLFSDQYYPLVVVGTSFSHARAFNFVGFLSEFTSLDSLKWAKPNARLEGSILSFFNSELYRNSPPAYLVWETSGYTFSSPNINTHLRQITPASLGGCTQGKKLTNIINTEAPETYLLDGLRIVPLFQNLEATEALTANNHFLELSYSPKQASQQLKQLRIFTEYADGNTEIRVLDHSFFDDNRQFYYLFNHLPKKLKSISIGLDINLELNLETAICTHSKLN